MKILKEVYAMKGKLLIFYDEEQKYVIEEYEVQLSPSGDSWKPVSISQLTSPIWGRAQGWDWLVIKRDNKYIFGEITFYFPKSQYKYDLSFPFIIEFAEE